MVVGHLEPGERVTVELVADSSGNVALENDLVEIAGESSANTQVSVVETAGAGVAVLDRVPEEYDDGATYTAGEVIGEAMVRLAHPVQWVTPTTAGALAAGDVVASDVGGTVDAYDSVSGDTPDMIFGRVWATNQRGVSYTADLVAVVRQK